MDTAAAMHMLVISADDNMTFCAILSSVWNQSHLDTGMRREVQVGRGGRWWNRGVGEVGWCDEEIER